MNQTNPNAPDYFTIGLTMAGAVSAGAYTAGVIDVLLRSMDAHNAAVDRRRAAEANGGQPDPDAPRHKVVLKVMSGASAGGVSIGLGAVSLIRQNRAGRLADPSVKQGPADPAAPPYRYDYVLDRVHDVWVEKLDLWHDETRGFLTQGDIREDGVAISVLNSEHLDEVASEAMEDAVWAADARPYDFLADRLEMFFTTTNLMGVPYSVAFTGTDDSAEVDPGAASHSMAQHSVVRHFRLDGLGSADIGSCWLEVWRDDGIVMKMPEQGQQADFSLPEWRQGQPPDLPTPWAAFRQAAIATGAFPGGFSARLMRAQVKDYGISIRDGEEFAPIQGGAWLIEERPGDVGRSRAFGPAFRDEDWETEVPYVAVDGGVANNEPFEYARFTLRQAETREGAENYLSRNPRDSREATRAVIMIDPFPEGPKMSLPDLTKGERSTLGLLDNLLRLPGALINQARFKPSALLLAKSESIASRFLIAPSREVEIDGKEFKLSGSSAIASGALGGFIGFFDRNFRAHDFMLGQHNCHSFLLKHFNLDPANPVLQLSDDEIADWKRRVSAGEIKGVPVIRAVDSSIDDAGVSFPQPQWPRMGLGKLQTIKEKGIARLGVVGGSMINERGPGLLFNSAIKLLWTWGRLHLENALVGTVLADMIARDQVDVFAHLDPEARLVFRTLARFGRKGADIEALTQRLNREIEEDARAGGGSANTLTEDRVRAILKAEIDRERREGGAILWRPRGGDKGPFALTLNRPWARQRISQWLGSWLR